ncbi:MAG: citrate/2-methylcitrate synthase [Clostridia bacterium]|nr:citrate/2-methylcitrate synthase [Clostridia bacterium]
MNSELEKFYKEEEARKAERERAFQGCLTAAKEVNQIPQEAFENFRVKRGLREKDGTGVMAGVTNIGNAHGYMVYEGERIADEGKLEYRGFDMTALVDGVRSENRYGFEECVYILLFGKLPTAEELNGFKALLASQRHLPARFTEDILMKAPSPSIMNKMGMGVLALYAYDENPDDTSLDNMLRQSIEIIAKLPSIAAHSYAVYRSHYFKKSLNLHTPKDELSTAQNFLRMLRPDKQYTEEEARLLDLCMIIQAEHGGGNNSTFTCRVLSSSGTDTYSAISGAIGSLKGPLHGGANIKVQQMFDCMKENIRDIRDEEEIVAYIKKILNKEAYDGKGLIYGMGHAIYTKSDPRAVILKKYAEDLAVKKGYGDDFHLLETIERVTPDLFNAHKGLNKPMCANVDLYSGLVYRMLGIPVELYTPLFAIARVSGWCAHRIEEFQTAKKIIRPAYKSIAKAQDYIPLDQR